MNDILKALAAPLPPDAIEWRVGSTTANKDRGMALAYIDARTVQDRLDAVCGHLWQNEHTVSADGKKITCRIGVKIGEEWIWRSDGAGETDFEAEKGAYSDAFKRAGVKWGIGRYLYDMGAPWVALESGGKKIAASEMPKLLALAGGAKPAAQAPAAGSNRPPASSPPVSAAEDAIARFWKGASYELPGNDLLTFAAKFVKAAGTCPHPDALLKFEDDNADHLAAIKNGSASEWQKVQTALSAARTRLTLIAA